MILRIENDRSLKVHVLLQYSLQVRKTSRHSKFYVSQKNIQKLFQQRNRTPIMTILTPQNTVLTPTKSWNAHSRILWTMCKWNYSENQNTLSHHIRSVSIIYPLTYCLFFPKVPNTTWFVRIRVFFVVDVSSWFYETARNFRSNPKRTLLLSDYL